MVLREDMGLLLVNQAPLPETEKFMMTQAMNIARQQEKYLWTLIRMEG